MAKCYLCGHESNVEIKVEAYNHTDYICGVCALDRDIINDPDFAELIRQAENLPKGKACEYCKYLAIDNNRFYCKYHNNFELDKKEIPKNYCDNFERQRQ